MRDYASELRIDRKNGWVTFESFLEVVSSVQRENNCSKNNAIAIVCRQYAEKEGLIKHIWG